MKKTLISAAVASALLIPAMSAMAEDAPAAAAPPPDFSGHLDIAYSGLDGNGKFINGINDRVFDFDHNSGVFHTLDLQYGHTFDSGFGGLIEANLGTDADSLAAYGTIDRSRGPAAGVDKRFDLTQAYLSYSVDALTVIAGKYVTLVGAEVIKSDANVNYSRSILFGYAEPLTHTGLRATYKVSDALSLIGGVNNGWDDYKDTNSDKTIELGVAYTVSDALSFTSQLYSGKEQICNYPQSCLSGPRGTRTLWDSVVTYKATDQLTFMVNYDNGSQDNATLINGKTGSASWDGWAGYAEYQFNDEWRLVLRGEIFNDSDGYRTAVEAGKTTGQEWTEATLTLAYMPTKSVEVRAEARTDSSDQNVFLKADGKTASKDQSSFGLEVLFKF